MVELGVEAKLAQRAENMRVIQEAVRQRRFAIERAIQRGEQPVGSPFFSAEECKHLQGVVGSKLLTLFVLSLWYMAETELSKLGEMGFGIEIVDRPTDPYIKLIPKPSAPN